MVEISLLWLLLPSIGLAAYLQYTASHYDKKTEEIEKNIKGKKLDGFIVNHLPDEMSRRYLEITRNRESVHTIDIKQENVYYDKKDKTQFILKCVTFYIIFVVLMQYFALTHNHFYEFFESTVPEKSSVKEYVFYILSFLVLCLLCLYFYSLYYIKTKKQDWLKTILLDDKLNEIYSISNSTKNLYTPDNESNKA